MKHAAANIAAALFAIALFLAVGLTIGGEWARFFRGVSGVLFP